MMQHTATWTRLAGVLLLLAVLAGGIAPAAAGQEKGKLPAELIAAWQKAGAYVGWIHKDAFGHLEFVLDKDGKPGDVPAFRFNSWQKGVLPKLPAPAIPFGLNLLFSEVTDGDLKELAGLTTLQILDLSFNQVTDAGLKEAGRTQDLARLWSLQEPR